MAKHKEKILAAAVCAAAIAADQISKFAVRGLMESRNGVELTLIPGMLSFINSFNQGIAFGMFQGIRVWFLLLPIAMAIFILFFYLKEGVKGRMLGAAGLGLMLGGAFGNLIDRVRLGYVFDFVEAYYKSYHWPTFNTADALIVIGFFLFAIVMFVGTGSEGIKSE